MVLEIVDKKDVRSIRYRGTTEVGKPVGNLQLFNDKDVTVGNNRKLRNNSIKEFKDLKPYYWDNPYSPLYLHFIQRYIRKVVGAYKKGKYWVMNLDGKMIRVKHLSASLRTNFNEYAWHFPIKFDKKVGAFLLSAFSDRRTLEPMHLLFIRKDEIIEIGEEHRQLWNRSQLVIDAKTIGEFRRYEMCDQLVELTEIMKEVSIRENERNKTDLRRRLVFKQNEIRKKMGYSFNLEFMIHQAIYTGLADLERYYGIDKSGEFELVYDTRLDLIRELQYIMNKEEKDNELIDILKDLSAVFNMRINELIEMSMSYGLDVLNVDIVLDMIKVEEFKKMDMEYQKGRHIGGWRGRKKYIKGMNPVIREGLSSILRDFYLEMLR